MPSLTSPAARPSPHPRSIGWIGTTALAFGGSNQSLFLLGALLLAQGTAALPLLVVGLILSWMAVPGWTELVMMWPNRVGGIAATCSEAFRPYSPVLANLTGTCYWWGWVPTCGLTSILSASAIQQWYLPTVSVKLLASIIVILFTIINLCGVRWVTRFAVTIASVSAVLALASAVIPVLTGSVDWHQATSFHLTLPFHGTFGVLTSAMAGLYLIGFAAPAFEAATCHVGETRNHEKEVPRAIFASAGIASLYFVILPIVWLGALGPQALTGDLASALGPTFAPLLGAGAKAAALWFMVFNMFHGTLQPLAGASRTLSQLSEDGLLPRTWALRNRYDCPWVATMLTAGMSLALLVSGDPPAVIAAANLTYLISICMPSVAVWLLRRHAPDMPRPWRAPRYTIGLGLVAASVWAASTLLGFQQFGLKYVLLGLALAYSGSLAYSWRTWQDRRVSGAPKVKRTLGMKLTGSMVLVMVLDGAGYLLAVNTVDEGQAPLVALLQDIFVAVALLTIAVGLVLPGMISHAVVQVNDAAQRLQRGTLAELTRAMQALGRGDLDAARAHPELFKVDVRTQDEVAAMAVSFNAMQDEVVAAATSLDGAREELQASRERLEYLANHDPLTGLANRRRFDEVLDLRVQSAHAHGGLTALTMFDLDNFKMINDSRGHVVGDEVLKLVADVLRAELPSSAAIARLGGDEFAYLVPCSSPDEAEAVTRRVLTALHEHSAATDQGRRVKVAASAGIALFDGDRRVTSGQLMMDVDVAMYEAKEAGGNRLTVASADGAARQSVTTRQEWLDTLRAALDGEGFELYAQPIQSLSDGTITSYELLLRLIGADGRPIPPGEFLALAERHGLIREIDQWVVTHAFAQLRHRLLTDPGTRVEVNLSGLSIGDAALEALIATEMARGDIPPGAMVFEITETAAIVDLDAAAAFAHRIAALGCTWALDDFGAGFSSFLYLKTLPVTYVKIDGSFVRHLATSAQDRQVVHAMVQIAESMGLTTIAEFVEDAAILEVLQELGVDYAQGYFIGRPAPLAEPSPRLRPAVVPSLVPAVPSVAPAVPADPAVADRGLTPLEQEAAEVGAQDVLVFRRMAAGHLLHVGGTGRGAGWAGNVELHSDALATWPRSLRDPVVRWSASEPVHVLGPYHARSAALLGISRDLFVLLGSSEGRLTDDDDTLRDLARRAARQIEVVSPAKALADELEVLHAMQDVMQVPTSGLTQTLQHIVRSAAASLSCERAVLWLPGHDAAVTALAGPEADTDWLTEWAAGWDGQPLCEQDSLRQPLPAPLSPDDGVTSHLVMPLGAPTEGVLVLAHTDQAPRGFTNLCQRIAQAVAQAAGPVIDAAQIRSNLELLANSAGRAARRDALTGLANRRAWDEALQEAASSPRWVSVAMIDLNDLKVINDSSGHQAGDDYLREAAQLLRDAAQPGDVVARIGGDEFGILRCSDEPIDQGCFGSAARAAFPPQGIVRAAIGVAQCRPGDDLEQAVRRADVAMYLDKSLAPPRSGDEVDALSNPLVAAPPRHGA
jgi:diguanylate cyclase (GGDEF)-like protein